MHFGAFGGKAPNQRTADPRWQFQQRRPRRQVRVGKLHNAIRARVIGVKQLKRIGHTLAVHRDNDHIPLCVKRQLGHGLRFTNRRVQPFGPHQR